MGTLRFFEEVVSFKIRRTFGFADYIAKLFLLAGTDKISDMTFNFCLNLFLAEKPRNATCKKSGARKPILLIFKAFILPIPIQQDAKWK